MTFDVQDKVALVTGANRGIGLAITKSLFAHGVAKVYAAVRDVNSVGDLQSEFGDRVVPLEIDLEKHETIASASQAASDVQLLINNAGVLNKAKPLDEDAIESLKWQMDVNVYGLLRISQAFAQALKQNGGGALVQLNSIASLRGMQEISTYAASKAAAYSLTQSLRDQLESQRTQVLSVHPGPIDTEMAASAGLEDTDSPDIVAEKIVAALRDGLFHLFPDKRAKEMGEAYRSFAQAVIEPNSVEG